MYFILGLLIVNLNFIHPFHVSVCDITYKTADKHLKITIRMFVDDLEIGLQSFANDPKLDITAVENQDKVNGLLKNYLLNHLQISIGKKQFNPEYLGYENEENAIWAYIEIKKLKYFEELTVSYTPLMEIFEDQENLVHVRRDGEVRSMRMIRNKTEGTVHWD